MRSILTAAMAALLLLAGCAPQSDGSAAGHPNLIVVREFPFSAGVVTLETGVDVVRAAEAVLASARTGETVTAVGPRKS